MQGSNNDLYRNRMLNTYSSMSLWEKLRHQKNVGNEGGRLQRTWTVEAKMELHTQGWSPLAWSTPATQSELNNYMWARWGCLDHLRIDCQIQIQFQSPEQSVLHTFPEAQLCSSYSLICYNSCWDSLVRRYCLCFHYNKLSHCPILGNIHLLKWEDKHDWRVC